MTQLPLLHTITSCMNINTTKSYEIEKCTRLIKQMNPNRNSIMPHFVPKYSTALPHPMPHNDTKLKPHSNNQNQHNHHIQSKINHQPKPQWQRSLPQPEAMYRILMPTRGRRRVGETRFPSTAPLRRPSISQEVPPQNKSSPDFSALLVPSSTFFSTSTADIAGQTPARPTVKLNFTDTGAADLTASFQKRAQWTVWMGMGLAGKEGNG